MAQTSPENLSNKSSKDGTIILLIETVKGIADISKTLIPWVTVGFCFYCLSQAITVFAGVNSSAEVSIIADIKINKFFLDLIFFLFGAGGSTYGWRQNRLRKKDIKRLTGRLKPLEKQVDSNRSSTGLSTEGQHHPED